MRRIPALVLSVAMVLAFPVMGFAASGRSSSSRDTSSTGDETTTQELTDGTVVETTTEADGTTITETTTSNGKVTVDVDLSRAAVNAAGNDPVAVDVDEDADEINVTVPTSAGKTRVSLSVKNPGPTWVAVDSKTGEVVLTSTTDDNGVVVAVDGKASVKLETRPNNFTDTNTAFAKRAADFAYSHGLFVGTTDTTFTPNGTMNTGSLTRVINRLTGASNPVVDNGTAATRAAMIVELYKAVGSPAVTADLSAFADLGDATAEELAAYQWAVANGIIYGTTSTTMSPDASATRAQFATMLMRAVSYLQQN